MEDDSKYRRSIVAAGPARQRTLRPPGDGAPPLPALCERPSAPDPTLSPVAARPALLLLCGDVTDAWALGRAALQRRREPLLACDVAEAERILSLVRVDAAVVDGRLLAYRPAMELATAIGARRVAVLVANPAARYDALASLFKNATTVPWPGLPEHVIEVTRARSVTRRPGGIELSASSALRSALEEAADLAVGGEVIVRAGGSVGRVFFAGSEIAWAVATTMPSTFRDDLRGDGVREEDYDRAFAECQRTGANLAETLVEWGILPEPRLRAVLLARIATCVYLLASWPGARALFAPRPWDYRGNLTFAVGEVLTAVAEISGGLTRPHGNGSAEAAGGTSSPDREAP